MEFSEVLNSLNLDDNAKEKEMKYFASNNDFLRMNHGTHTSMALLGYPNAGKTSLFNHLTNRKETVDSACSTRTRPASSATIHPPQARWVRPPSLVASCLYQALYSN